MFLTRQKSLQNDTSNSCDNLHDVDLLQCMICFDTFKEPKMLVCAHTFCSKCLEDYYLSYIGQKRAIHGHIPCPNCRELTPWPANGAVGLRTDFKVQQIEDLLKTMSTQVQSTTSLNFCGSCCAQNKKIPAKSYCFNCEKSYCSACTSRHSRNSLFNNHKVVTVSNNNRNDTKEVKCRAHPEEDCKYLCRTCDSIVCTLCLMTGHTKHEAVELNVAIKEQLDNLKTFMTSINVKKDRFLSFLSGLEPLLIQCQSACSDAEKSITSKVDKMMSDIKRQEADLLSQIKATREKKLSILEREVVTTKRTLSQIKGIENMMANTTLTPSKSFKTYELLMQRIATFVEFDSQQDLRSLKANAVLVNFIPSQENSTSLGQILETRAKLPASHNMLSKEQVTGRSENTKHVGRSQQGNECRSLLAVDATNNSPARRSKSPLAREFIYPRLVFELNKRGSQRGELNEPLWVTCLLNSRFVVSDKGNKRLQIFDMAGRLIETITGHSIHPAGVAVTLKGNLIFADTNQKCIEVFTPEGRRLQKWGDGKFFSPCGVAVCPNGNIVISDLGNNTVSVYRNESTCVFVLGLSAQQEQQFKEPSYVIAGPHNEIIISDSKNHCIKIFNSQGKFVTEIGTKGFGDGEFNHPCGVCTDYEGNMFVADFGNDRISMVSRNGVFLSHVLTREHGIKSPRDVFLAPDGKFIVTESNPSRSTIKIYDLANGNQ